MWPGGPGVFRELTRHGVVAGIADPDTGLRSHACIRPVTHKRGQSRENTGLSAETAGPQPSDAPVRSGALGAAGPGQEREPLRLMAVHAHPDDESSKGAATMARYVRDGAEVLVCTLTGGERGDVLNPAMDRPDVRAAAAAAAAGDGPGAGDPRSQPAFPGVHRLRPAGRRPAAAVACACFALTPLEEAARPFARCASSGRTCCWLTTSPAVTRTRITSCPTRSPSRRSRRPPIRSYPGTGPGTCEPWQPAEALLLRLVPARPVHGLARGDAPSRPGVPVRQDVRAMGGSG